MATAAVLARGAREGAADESKIYGVPYGVDGDASNARDDRAIDWLEQSPDLPHLIARLSELVHRLGHAPEDLLVLPRAELERRELAAYSAGWADVVAEELPAVRRAYEERITAAYLQGQEDARTGDRPRRARRPEGQEGGHVIPLPYLQLLRPPTEVTRVEERGERERSVADGSPAPTPEPADEGEGASGEERGAEQVPDDGRDKGGILLSARDVRGRSARSDRRRVVRRNGRPSVPPLTRPGDHPAGREKGRRPDAPEQHEEPPETSGPRPEDRPRLSDKARALADELEGRGKGRHRDEDDDQPTPEGPRDRDRPQGRGERDRSDGRGERERTDGRGERERTDGRGERERTDGRGERDRPDGRGERDRPDGGGERDRPDRADRRDGRGKNAPQDRAAKRDQRPGTRRPR
ncbi:hypothetical protein ACGFNV_10865 [Streptomyces sp. NPDC048751]|uniref:hypothetical protein n=1 Tax=Streptomyces sp. NPDC048751 TaxID=3365591 RepID=UPI003715DDBC